MTRDPTITYDIYGWRLPEPHVHEDASESAWLLWDEAVTAMDTGQ
jgi:hypothetical protein